MLAVPRRPAARLARAALVAALLFATTGADGCHDRSGAAARAARATAVADSLARYYDVLADHTAETLEAEAFLAALRGVELDPEPLRARSRALAARAGLARDLGAAWAALGRLAEGDPAPAAAAASEDLASAIAALDPAGPGAPEPAALFGTLAGEMAAWRRDADLAAGARLLDRATARVADLFDREAGLYDAIAEERWAKDAAVAAVLIRQGLVAPQPLLEPLHTALDLRSSASIRAVDAATAEAFVAVARIRLERRAAASRAATRSLRAALADIARR